MTQGEPLSRGRVGRDLIREARRLNQHIDHLSVEEAGHLNDLVAELTNVHDNDEKCRNLCRNYSKQYPPWGTRYANAVERAILTVFPKRR